MISSWLNAIGIFFATVGVILTLLTILKTDKNIVGTYGEPIERRKQFPGEQRKAWWGCGMIAIGGVLQIIGQFV